MSFPLPLILLLGRSLPCLTHPLMKRIYSSDEEIDVGMDTNAKIMGKLSKAKVDNFDVGTWRNALAGIYVSASLEDQQAFITYDSISAEDRAWLLDQAKVCHDIRGKGGRGQG